jgi:hypothetical protein
LLALFLVLLSNLAFSQEYSAKGQIEIVTKLVPNDPGKREVLRFYVEVLAYKYKIKIEEFKKPDWYYEYAFDDGVMRILHHIPPTPKKGEKITNSPAVFPARIENREIPPNDGTRAQFVWLALASANFFSNLTNDLLLPIWSPEDPKIRQQPFPMLAFYERLTGTPQLPSKVSYVNDGFYRSYNPVKKSHDIQPLASPYDKGFTNAVYQVLGLTNTANITLPAEFVFAVYSSPLGSGEIPFERILIQGSVFEIGDTVTDKAEIGGFDGLASVADYRIHGESRRGGQVSEYKYAAYSITNANWLNSNQLQKVRTRIEAGLDNKLTAAGKSNRKVVIVGIFGVSSAAILVVFWRTVRSEKNQLNKKTKQL